MWKRLVCRIVGHVVSDGWEDFDALCPRCGRPVWAGGGSLRERLWVFRWRCHRWRREKLDPWLRCPDCGWRFGRHDPDHDHIPF